MPIRRSRRWKQAEIVLAAVLAGVFVVVAMVIMPKPRSPESPATANGSTASSANRSVAELDTAPPDVTLQSVDGALVSLRASSATKVVVLLLWTSSCEPCIRQLEALDAAASQPVGWQAFAVNRGESADAARAAASRAGASSVRVLLDPNGLLDRDYPFSEPVTTYFVKRGTILGVAVGSISAQQILARVATLQSLE